MNKNKAVFLDRDGVINHDSGYVYKASDFTFITGVFDACRALQNAGFLLVIVTNQSGVARGYYSEQDVIDLHHWVKSEFSNERVDINKIYFCPHHKEFGLGDYKKDCQCRKPNPGMLLKAKNALNLDMSQCIMVGDKESDMQAGKRAGVGKTVYITGNAQNSQNIAKENTAKGIEFADYHVESLWDFIVQLKT